MSDRLDLAKQFAEAGEPEGPTADQVARGYHGNGTWDSSPEAMVELQARSREVGAARRKNRIAAYERKMENYLESSAELQGELVKEGLRIMRECRTDERTPTADEMDLIKRAQKASEFVPTRVIGKPTQRTEHSGKVDFVGLIAGTAQLDDDEEEYEEVDFELEAADVDEDSWDET